MDYVKAIAALAKKLPSERAAQLYDFARFLLVETSVETSNEVNPVVEEDPDSISITDEALAEEDAVWAAMLERHAHTFAELKAQAKADVQAGKTTPMFDARGDFDEPLKA